MEHASHIAAQPQFVHPEHRSFIDLSGHNLANPHPFAGRTVLLLLLLLLLLLSRFSRV